MLRWVCSFSFEPGGSFRSPPGEDKGIGKFYRRHIKCTVVHFPFIFQTSNLMESHLSSCMEEASGQLDI